MMATLRDGVKRVRHRAQAPRCSATRSTRRPSRRLATTVAVSTAAGVAACAVLSGCSSSPAPTPELSAVPNSPGAGPGYQDSRITLPETVDLSFHHPQLTGRTEHEVLFTVQQALRAQLHAEYSTNTDPLLAVYWSGSALAAAHDEIAVWLKKGEQPVGVLVITNTAYTEPNSAGVAGVTYCASWSDVVAGKADTHVVGGAVQPTGSPGTYTALTLTRAAGHRWQIMTLTATADSPRCTSSSSDTSDTSSSSDSSSSD